MTVLVVIGILVAMLMPATAYFQGRMARAACVKNLSNLYVGASGFIQEQGHWPQVPTRNLKGREYAEGWLQALRPYGISEPNWVCPTVDRSLKKGLDESKKDVRIDYFATPFGSDSRDPFKYPTQPWFAERGDVHGDGNLIIFTNGEILSLHQVYRDKRFQRGAQ